MQHVQAVLNAVALHPAMPFAMLSLLAMFLGFKAFSMLTWRNSAQQVSSGLSAHLQEIESTLRELRTSVSAIQPQERRQEAGMHGERRERALGLLARGETPQTVAATLSVPSNQIELLMKVQSILERQRRSA